MPDTEPLPITSARFEAFLETVDLAAYREQYSSIKTVEMDLPKNIQAIASLYEVYWSGQELLTFEEFYAQYYATHQHELREFQEKVRLCVNCFALGLPARIYRTWASLVTQIHAGYVAQDVFGAGTVSMSAELDYKGIDFQVNYSGRLFNFQVKKQTQSREVRQARTLVSPVESIYLEYIVPTRDVFDRPKKRNGEHRKPYLEFLSRPHLKRLTNGFVVFTPEAFTPYKVLADKAVEAAL